MRTDRTHCSSPRARIRLKNDEHCIKSPSVIFVNIFMSIYYFWLYARLKANPNRILVLREVNLEYMGEHTQIPPSLLVGNECQLQI